MKRDIMLSEVQELNNRLKEATGIDAKVKIYIEKNKSVLEVGYFKVVKETFVECFIEMERVVNNVIKEVF